MEEVRVKKTLEQKIIKRVFERTPVDFKLEEACVGISWLRSMEITLTHALANHLGRERAECKIRGKSIYLNGIPSGKNGRGYKVRGWGPNTKFTLNQTARISKKLTVGVVKEQGGSFRARPAVFTVLPNRRLRIKIPAYAHRELPMARWSAKDLLIAREISAPIWFMRSYGHMAKGRWAWDQYIESLK